MIAIKDNESKETNVEVDSLVNIDPPDYSWSTFHKICGWIAIVLGCGAFLLHEDIKEIKLSSAIILIASGISCLFISFCVNQLVNIRYSSQISAEKNMRICELLEGNKDEPTKLPSFKDS